MIDLDFDIVSDIEIHGHESMKFSLSMGIIYAADSCMGVNILFHSIDMPLIIKAFRTRSIILISARQ